MNITRDLNRRHLTQAVAPAAAFIGASAMAQACSIKPDSLNAPFPAGRTTDVLIHALADTLVQARWAALGPSAGSRITRPPFSSARW